MENVPKLITPEELSQILTISEFTIRKLAQANELPCRYVKRQMFFEFDVLIDFLRSKESAA